MFTAACVLSVAAASAHGSSPEKPRKNGAATPENARQKERTATTQPTRRVTIKETARVRENIRVQPRPGTVVAIHANTVLRRAGQFFFCLPESTPYLQDVASPGIRVENNIPFIRRPPLLPKIITPSDKTAIDAANLPQPAPHPEGNGDAAEGAPKKTMDDVVDFFRDSGDRQGNDKGLGETFDPTFTPAPLPPTSSATYRRE